MASLCECRLFNRTLTIDDISKKPQCKNIKFKRAFQFLQLLLIQRVYGIDVISCSKSRRPLTPPNHNQQEEEEEKKQNFEVFLGGSCNPTTWRHDQAIPYFQSRSVSYYNPQRSDWTPDLVEIEHRAKELAPLLFFVIDHDTRALASIVEVCYLAARGRSIIVVMNPMLDKNQTRFIQQKTTRNETDNENDYENVCEARRTLRTLLQSINIPVFDNVRLALECAAFILETTKRTVTNNSAFNEDNGDEQDVLTPLPTSPSEINHIRPSSVVVIRSLSNQTTFESPDEFYRQMNQSEMTPTFSPTFSHRRHSSTPESNHHQFRATTVCTKTQLSSSTNESDDDGYGSLSSSNRTLSLSTSSISSESFEATTEHQREDNPLGSYNKSSTSMMNNLLSTFYSYVPFVHPPTPPPPSSPDSSVTQSIFVLFTLPFRFIKDTILSATSPLTTPTTVSSPSQESVLIDVPSSISSSPHHMFDLYVASGKNDECWLKTFALPFLEKTNINFIQRQSYHENDQLDVLYDMHVRKQSRVLYYLINDNERLSHLASELAFLIGERKHKIIVYLRSNIDEHSENILSACERRDVQRSRKYVEDLARKENITLFYSREESWQEVLTFFLSR